jgi:hypothetical protein
MVGDGMFNVQELTQCSKAYASDFTAFVLHCLGLNAALPASTTSFKVVVQCLARGRNLRPCDRERPRLALPSARPQDQ